MTFVYEVTNGGITTHIWSCAPCIEKRRSSGWTVKAGVPLPDGSRCQDCIQTEQAAPGYVTPTVEAAPTRPESRLPSRSEVRKMPGCAPMKPWPEPKAEKPKRAA